MGRCYEFGASITEGCECAMVVGPEGGYCHCQSCGVSCPGRFRGCAAVVVKPGYVPPGAPAMAVAVPEPRASLGRAAQTGATVDKVAQSDRSPAHMAAEIEDPELAELRGLLRVILERPDPVLHAIESLQSGMLARDEELVAVFNRLVVAFQNLTEEVRKEHSQLAETIGRLVTQTQDADDRDGLRSNPFAG